MTRRFAWILNLDAELELSRSTAGYVAPRKLVKQLAEHGQSSRQLLGPDDVLLDEEGPEARTERAELIGRAWCPTPMAIARMQALGVEPETHPDASVLRRVNHRLFAHELGGGLPGQAYVTSRKQLQEQLGTQNRGWLLKRPLSFAGRGQLRAIGPLTEKQQHWVDVSLARDGLLVEPLVQPTLELSVHGFIWPDARRELGRICVQLVTERGHFRAVQLANRDDLLAGEAQALMARCEAVAEALLQAGYFGPFGVDGYRYRDGAAAGFCALGEINARYTLGFVTGFPRPPSQLVLA